MPNSKNPNDIDYCKQEARLATIENKLENKKENIHEIHEDYYHLREKLETISQNVVELTTIMRENQKKEDENDKKIEELQLELAKANLEINRISSSLDTLKWVLGLGVPIASTILGLIVNYLI